MNTIILLLWTGVLPESLPMVSGAPREARLAPPSGVRATDNPNDAGKRIKITWQLSPDDGRLDNSGMPMVLGYFVERQTRDSTAVKRIGFAGSRRTTMIDDRANNECQYRYRVLAFNSRDTVASEWSDYACSSAQWFHTGRVNVLITGLLFSFLVLWFTARARKGVKFFIRRIAGLDAVEEALGRATEMGRATLFVPGLGAVEDIATIASLNILGEVAKKTAQYGTPLIVPNRNPIVYTVAREVVKESHTRVGRPDTFNPDSVFYLTDDQFAFAAAVDGIMTRERPATNFLIGAFWAESLILAETGAAAGAVQIAGTDQVTQLPFFVTACDYTLLGEELYAASAYLAQEPMLMAAIKAQDYAKAIIVLVLIVATVLLLTTQLPVASWF